MNYYVYYKVPAHQVDSLRPRVQALFAAIREQCGVQGRWMHRRDDPATYMEVYEDVRDPARFEALLAREGAALGLERHVERFVPA